MIHIDFETRSKVDLKKSGAWRYAEDPSTNVLCMAYQHENGEVNLWTPQTDYLFNTQENFLAWSTDQIFIAHNAGFERAIYENILVKRYGFPELSGGQWRCSAAKAAAHAIPRALSDACGALALPMQKDSAGRATMMKLAKPRKPTKENKAEWHTDPKDFQILYDYCMQDIRAEVGLYKRLPDLIEEEQKIWVLDQEINVRGIHVDMETVEAAIVLIEEYNKELTEELNILTDQIVGSADERDKIMQWCAINGLEFSNLQKGTVVDALAGDLPDHVKNKPAVRRVLEIRQQLGKTSTAKYQAIKDAVCSDGRLRDLLLYHGASTGRWAGKGPQPQNLPINRLIKNIDEAIALVRRRNLEEFRFCYEDPMEALSCLLRPMFMAAPGRILVGGDYSQIEVRVLFWLAGEEPGLNMFRKGEDLYVDLAKKIYRTEKIDKEKRELGKRGILGCGYGMGAKKFIDTCIFYGLQIPADLYTITEDGKGNKSYTCKVIEVYREEYRSVVKFWNDQESAAIEAVKRGTLVTAGKIKWKTANGFLYCRLPSGRCLAYCHPKIEMVETPWGAKKEALTFMSVNPKTKHWSRGSTYGGALAENITQAVARDIMADAMLRAERNGYEMKLTVHDEMIAELEENPTPERYHNFGCLMCDIPKWAEGLPIKAETWKGVRYSK